MLLLQLLLLKEISEFRYINKGDYPRTPSMPLTAAVGEPDVGLGGATLCQGHLGSVLDLETSRHKSCRIKG